MDPVALLGCRLSVCEKHDHVIKLGPCQLSKHVLNHSQKSMQRHCSKQVFVHTDGIRRQWILLASELQELPQNICMESLCQCYSSETCPLTG